MITPITPMVINPVGPVGGRGEGLCAIVVGVAVGLWPAISVVVIVAVHPPELTLPFSSVRVADALNVPDVS